MRMPGKKTLARIVRPLKNTLRPGGLVLGYHRIADESWDPLGLCVQPSRFRQQLELLRELYTPVSLCDMVRALKRGREVKRCVALTFDDGYHDFIVNALPVLEQLDMPATVFVATGFKGKAFWWDEVVSALDRAHQSSSSLTLRWPGGSSDRIYKNLDARDRATRVARDLCRELSVCGAHMRAQILEQLPNESSSMINSQSASRPMSNEDIRVLARCPIIEVGSHTVSHSQLAHLEKDEQLKEIETSKRELETLVGDEICGFSYPHGSISMHSRDHLQNAGFRYACTSREAVVWPGTDAYVLPRVWARDVGTRKFRKWIASWRGIRIGKR